MDRNSSTTTGLLVLFASANAIALRAEPQALLLLVVFVLAYAATLAVLRLLPWTALTGAAFAGAGVTAVWRVSQGAAVPLADILAGSSGALILISALKARSEPRPRFQLFLLISALLGSVLAFSSGDAGGPDGMYRWFQDTFGWDAQTAEVATIAVRKGIHFFYFGLIGWTAFRGALGFERPLNEAAMFALWWTATFAAYDEISQLASPVRSGSALDVGLDLLGAGTFVWLAVRGERTRTVQDP